MRVAQLLRGVSCWDICVRRCIHISNLDMSDDKCGNLLVTLPARALHNRHSGMICTWEWVMSMRFVTHMNAACYEFEWVTLRIHLKAIAKKLYVHLKEPTQCVHIWLLLMYLSIYINKNMYLFIYIYICIYTYLWAYLYICKYTYLYMCIDIFRYIYTRIYIHLQICIYIINIYIYVCTYINICMHIYTYMYINMYIDIFKYSQIYTHIYIYI